MKKLIAITLAVVLLAGLIGGGVALAQGTRASKATAAVSDLTLIDPNRGADNFTTILEQPIKMAQKKDLFVDVSLLCGLFTQTTVIVQSQDPEWSTGDAIAKIMVRVYAEKDGTRYYASPPKGLPTGLNGNYTGEEGIIFAMREQNLWAKLNTDNASDNMTIGLALDTMDAHSFNFIIPNLDSGVYDVVVQASTYSFPAGGKGKNREVKDAAWAGLGFGSVTIEQVRMANDTSIIEIFTPE